MSSCVASCSICCRLVSYASATSASSLTGNAPRCCHYAVSCCMAHSKMRLRPHHLPQISLIHSGTAQCVVEPCASSNGSPLHNSCFALHLNQTGAQHEPLSTSSALERASAPTQIPCLIGCKLLCDLLLPPRPDDSSSGSAVLPDRQSYGYCSPKQIS